MAVFIYRNNQQYGPYSIDQLKGWLSSGQIQATDLACYEGSTTWVPISTVLGIGNYPSPVTNVYGRPSSGWGLIITGLIIGVIGVLLSVTIIGAIIGIPMMIAGIPMSIYGISQYRKRMMWDLKESVRVGVVQGMPAESFRSSQEGGQQYRLAASSTPAGRFCSNCAATLDADARFCPSCATPTA